jgi:putative transposase
VKFSFIDQYQGALTQVELCALLEVSDRGYRAWRARPISRRQRDDMVILAHIREHHRLSMESYALHGRVMRSMIPRVGDLG